VAQRGWEAARAFRDFHRCCEFHNGNGEREKSASACGCVAQSSGLCEPGIKIKGEISGSEDLFVDGQIEGRITCGNSTVTLGRMPP